MILGYPSKNYRVYIYTLFLESYQKRVPNFPNGPTCPSHAIQNLEQKFWDVNTFDVSNSNP